MMLVRRSLWMCAVGLGRWETVSLSSPANALYVFISSILRCGCIGAVALETVRTTILDRCYSLISSPYFHSHCWDSVFHFHPRNGTFTLELKCLLCNIWCQRGVSVVCTGSLQGWGTGRTISSSARVRTCVMFKEDVFIAHMSLLSSVQFDTGHMGASMKRWCWNLDSFRPDVHDPLTVTIDDGNLNSTRVVFGWRWLIACLHF